MRGKIQISETGSIGETSQLSIGSQNEGWSVKGHGHGIWSSLGKKKKKKTLRWGKEKG